MPPCPVHVAGAKREEEVGEERERGKGRHQEAKDRHKRHKRPEIRLCLVGDKAQEAQEAKDRHTRRTRGAVSNASHVIELRLALSSCVRRRPRAAGPACRSLLAYFQVSFGLPNKLPLSPLFNLPARSL